MALQAAWKESPISSFDGLSSRVRSFDMMNLNYLPGTFDDKTVTLDKIQLFVKTVKDYEETTVDRKVTLAQKTHQFLS